MNVFLSFKPEALSDGAEGKIGADSTSVLRVTQSGRVIIERGFPHSQTHTHSIKYQFSIKEFEVDDAIKARFKRPVNCIIRRQVFVLYTNSAIMLPVCCFWTALSDSS